MLPVNYGGENRIIPVPTDLSLPNLDKSLSLSVIDKRLGDAIRASGPSNWSGIKAAHGTNAISDVALSKYPGLRDELADLVNSAARAFDPALALARCKTEFQAARDLQKRFPDVERLLDEDFIKLASEINRQVAGGKGSLRAGDIFIRGDPAGNRVQFPSHDKCPHLLRVLHNHLRSNVGRFPAMSAVVALVGIVHAHPFRDGNGRTARVLFNTIAGLGCGSGHFLPLALLASLSRGGFVLKLRRAMYGAEWDQLGNFFVDTFRLSGELQRPASKSGAANHQ